MILVDGSLVSMMRLSRKFLGGGRYTGAPRFNETIEMRSCSCGAHGDVFFP